MADDNDDWFSSTDDPAPTSFAKDTSAAEESAEAPAAAEAEAEGEYSNTEKVLLFKHWKRPRFLPYKYLTDYRKNYYDDILDYLDKRARGIDRDIPVSQTWGERALRTYTKYSNKLESYRIRLSDKKLVEETRYSGKFQLSHYKNYVNKRYYSFLY